MEHEVYVPFAVGAVRAALTEPERVARCVPGLQPETSEPVPGDGVTLEGRLRVRIGGSSITYRGTLLLAPETDGEDDGGDGRYTVRGEGTEARGDGSVKLTLMVVPRPAGDGEGTVLACAAELRGSGRLTDYEQKQRLAAGRRLLDRFGGELAASMAADPVGPAGAAAAPGGIGEPDDNEPVIPGIPAPETPESVDARSGADAPEAGEPEEPENGEPADGAGRSGEAGRTEGAESVEGAGEAEPAGVFETEVPPPSLEPVNDEFGGELDGELGDGIDDGSDGEQRPVTAEAAHARRTMIGRSAEEVDHAPPRGRYAPVPPPRTDSSARAVLRWAAPAAVLVLASVVVLGRVLRRRH